MKHIYFIIGISGVGKTYWCRENMRENDILLDSDAIRQELWGDAANQQQPNKVFDLMFRRTCNALRANHNVFYCATNLSMKHRIHFINNIRSKFSSDEVAIHCIICVAPIEVCKERNASRTRHVPEEVIERQARQFQMPVENEGWSSIEVVFTSQYSAEVYKKYLLEQVINFGSQENKHHKLNLFAHCSRCGMEAAIATDNKDICLAANIHDFGKLYTKTYWPEKDNDAHYPNHAEYGALLALIAGFSPNVAALVCYHMIPYTDEKAQKTWRARLGETLWNKILLLHEQDEKAH